MSEDKRFSQGRVNPVGPSEINSLILAESVRCGREVVYGREGWVVYGEGVGDFIIKDKPRFREWRLFGRHIYLVHEDGLLGNVIFFDSDQIGVTASVTCQQSQRAGIVKALRILANQIEETIA